jgi:cation/acetate symporter
MSQTFWNFLFIGLSFAVYIWIAVRSRAGSTSEFYVAGKGVSPLANGMATAADWMSAATFISMSGVIALQGYDGGRFLMGWTGGFVLLTVLMVPFLRKFGKETVPDFVGDRFESNTARLVAVVCAIFICLIYIMGQMSGVGLVFSQLFGISKWSGVVIGGAIVFFYSSLGGMKGITYTQVAQYIVMAFSFTLPAILISMAVTGNLIPQLGLIGNTAGDNPEPFLNKLNAINEGLGFSHYTSGKISMLNMFCMTLVLMAGTAGLPHVIVRFFTVKDVKAVRTSTCWTLLFVAVIYLTAPAVGAFARVNLIEQLNGVTYKEAPAWLATFEGTRQMKFEDKNGDGKIQYLADTEKNELTFDPDIMVMANPYMGGLPKWVIGLLMAGCVAAALSTAAGLLLVLSTSISHDLMKKILKPNLSDKEEMRWARGAALVALIIAIWFGIHPPGKFVAETVAFAFGLAASTFFPTLLIGIFSKRVGGTAALIGMSCGLTFTLLYIIYFQFGLPFVGKGTVESLLFGIVPAGIGVIGMLINFVVTIGLSFVTKPASKEVQDMVGKIRLPN